MAMATSRRELGTGGAPEGVLTAAALRCLNGQILARLVVSKKEHAERLEKMGVTDLKRVYDTEDLAPGKKMIFACTGRDGRKPAEGCAVFRRRRAHKFDDSDAG